MKFQAYGHPNITAKHKTTLEFTKDKDLSLRGDCITGVRADFSLKSIKEFIRNLKDKKIKIIIEINIKNSILKKSLIEKSTKHSKNKKIEEVIHAEINPDFNSDREMVIRKSDFKDERTFAVRADKGASELKKGFVERMKEPEQEISVTMVRYRNVLQSS